MSFFIKKVGKKWYLRKKKWCGLIVDINWYETREEVEKALKHCTKYEREE